MLGPFDPLSMTAGVAANLATTILQKHSERLRSGIFGKGLVKLGLLKPDFHGTMQRVLAASITEHVKSDPRYQVKGIVEFFSSEEVARIISEYMLDGRPADKSVIIGFLADCLDIPRETNLLAWPNGLDPIRFWDGFEVKISQKLALEADEGAIWISRQLIELKSAVYAERLEGETFRKQLSSLFSKSDDSNENEVFERQYLDHVGTRAGRLVTPGARDLQGVSQSLSVHPGTS